MDEHIGQESNSDRPVPAARVSADHIRSSAIGLLIGGGICLYFGLTLIAMAPGSASQDEAQRWFALDNALFWSLRIVGVAFLAAAGLAGLGQRMSLALAAVTEVVLALLMVAMSVVWTWRARADGTWDYQIILLLLLAIISVGGARRCWEWYRASLPARGQVDSEGEY